MPGARREDGRNVRGVIPARRVLTRRRSIDECVLRRAGAGYSPPYRGAFSSRAFFVFSAFHAACSRKRRPFGSAMGAPFLLCMSAPFAARSFGKGAPPGFSPLRDPSGPLRRTIIHLSKSRGKQDRSPDPAARTKDEPALRPARKNVRWRRGARFQDSGKLYLHGGIRFSGETSHSLTARLMVFDVSS